MIKLVAVDMDGTFLNSHSDYDHEAFRDVFEKMKDRDMMFVIASGNQAGAMYERIRPFGDDIYFVCDNGAYIGKGQSLIKTKTLPQDDALKILDLLLPYDNLNLVYSCEKAAHLLKKDKYCDSIIHKYYRDVVYEDDLKTVTDPVLKFSIRDPECHIKDYINILQPLLPEGYMAMTTGNEWFDIISIQATKGEGIRVLQEAYHLSEDECMCFGDQMNDMSLFEVCTYSYAMANAVPELKKKAYGIAPSNDDNGVIKTILDTIKKQG